MITGSIRLDLSEVHPDRHRHRVAALSSAPDGCRVVLVVGALTLVSDALYLLLEHTNRLHFDVQGEPFAVKRWVEAMRSGEFPGWSP